MKKKQVFQNIKHIFIGKASGKITNSTDNILISVLVSTAECGVYANYALVMNSIKGLFTGICSSITGSVGNLMVTEDSKAVHSVHKKITFIYFVFALISANGFFCAVDRFVRMAFGADYLLSLPVVVVCTVNFFLFIAREPLWCMMSVSGIFSKDKNTSIAGTIINLVVSVAVGIKYGMLGIFIGTVCTLVIQIVLKLILLYKYKIKYGQNEMLLYWLKMFIVLSIDLGISKIVCNAISISNNFIAFVLYGFISVGISIIIIYSIYSKSNEFSYLIDLVNKMLKRRTKNES